MRILAIDPGPTESAYVVYNGERVVAFDKIGNEGVCLFIEVEGRKHVDSRVVVEQIQSFGMAVGAEVFETVWWSGRFDQSAYDIGLARGRVTRKAVKMHLCGSMRAKDGNIRQALIDRYGGKEKAIGKKAKPGPLYGVSGDCWSALAVAVTYADTMEKHT